MVWDSLLYNAVVLLSLASQYGTPATALAKSVARLEYGSLASPVGELNDNIVKEVETSNQSNNQGSADTYVLAEKGQAKEGRGSFSRASLTPKAGYVFERDEGPDK